MNLGIDIQSADAISRAFVAFPAMVVREMETAMLSSMAYLDRETRERTPAAQDALTPKTSGSWRALRLINRS